MLRFRLLHPTCLLSCLVVVLSGCGRQLAMEDSAAEPASVMQNTATAMSPSMRPDEGMGPGLSGDQHDPIIENPFQRVVEHPRSTFSIDVDTASYSKVRQHLLDYNQLPRPDAVRIEEMLNYFAYQYQPPSTNASEPFAVHVAVTQCPWNRDHQLARLALKGREMEDQARPSSNLVLLIDASGSMRQHNKLPLLKRGMQMLMEQLNESDRIAIVAYAGAAGLVLDSTPAHERSRILAALNRLQAGGSTNGGEGLQLAYQVARDHFIPGGTNRVLLCTDGDFNVGMTGTDQMVRFIEDQAKGGIELTVLGFGMGNLNDSMLEQISGRGNGNYAFIDTENEAKKVLAEQLTGTLVTIAKDVKIQVEFNPNSVSAYRLVGYENRMLAAEDFNDDKKDAGEIGAGHRVTAIYELVPTGVSSNMADAAIDPLKYQTTRGLSPAADSDELFTVKLRYKLPDEDESRFLQRDVTDSGESFEQADTEFRFAVAVAGFGMQLRESEYRGDWTLDSVMQVAEASLGSDPHGFRQEFLRMVAAARSLKNQ